MHQHESLPSCVSRAHRNHRCAVPRHGSEHKQLSRYWHKGVLVKPYPNVYADACVWERLSRVERMLWVERALSLVHPDWVFAGLSAAAIHRIAGPSYWYDESTIYIATQGRTRRGTGRRLQHIHSESKDCNTVQGVRVTSVADTLFACAGMMPFRDALSMFDSALSLGKVMHSQLESTLACMRQGKTKLVPLVAHASEHSGSVGESLCRGTLLEEGFPPPLMQAVHRNPYRPGRVFRTDFEFSLSDGGVVIVEFDGMQKYTDPAMTGNSSIRRVVQEEQQRERALLAEPNVTAIIRCTYSEMMDREPLVAALSRAGVPRSIKRWYAPSQL